MRSSKPFSIAARLTLCAFACALQSSAFAQLPVTCPRFPVGSTITAPEDLYSRHGVLELALTYQTAVDNNGNTLYCFVSSNGAQSPTLHVQPGDRLRITLTNNVPAPTGSPNSLAMMPGMTMMGGPSRACGAMTMTSASVNIHYHGTNTPPTCHQDEVIRTRINSGQMFQYDVQFPWDEPPGLYWYHPHVHGISEPAVQGGASGALIVEGIQNMNPIVAGLPQQLLIIRDNPVAGNPTPGGNIPSWDLSLNYTPVPYPNFTPAVIQVKPSERQFWRVLNASADTIIDLQLQYDGTPQPLEVVALDGVPTGSQDGSERGRSFIQTHVLLAPAARVEFVVAGPSSVVQNATLVTLNIDTGPDGDNDPARSIATIQASANAPEPPRVPFVTGPPLRERFEGLDRVTPTAERKLYFSELLSDPNQSEQPHELLHHRGRADSDALSVRTIPRPSSRRRARSRIGPSKTARWRTMNFIFIRSTSCSLDMIQIPYWTGSGPYPTVKVPMEFRVEQNAVPVTNPQYLGDLTGDFVYHCHILGHEDGGMMAIIRVKPARCVAADELRDKIMGPPR